MMSPFEDLFEVFFCELWSVVQDLEGLPEMKLVHLQQEQAQ